MLERAERLLNRLGTRLGRVLGLLQVTLDVLIWGSAAALALYLRFGLELSDTETNGLYKAVPMVGVIQLLAGLAVGLYRRRWRYGSFDEVAALGVTSLITVTSFFLLNLWYFDVRPLPQSVVLVAGVLGLVMMAGIRYVWRLARERLHRPDEATATKLLVFGAGAAGARIITSLMGARGGPYLPVAILDDNPAKARFSIRGVPVVGTREDMATAARRAEADTLLIAVPSASSKLMQDLAAKASDAGLTVKVLPPVEEIFGEVLDAGDIRDLNEADLLGRHQISTNLDEIAGYLNGKRVLVTGAGGSIGSELCRQVMRLGPGELMMLDRDESALHQVQLSIEGQALLDQQNTILCDIRDVAALQQIFEDRRPQVVFHAAALKHLPLLEQYPDEAFKSNVIGTLNVLRAAESVGVERFVNISTDKAANPISVLGYSKRVAERLTAHMATAARSGVYLSVRFGNVLNSRGSVLTTFHEQILKGGPVTVTHRQVTRYFMTIPEAVQLTIQAGAIGRPAQVLVLDMGEPVSIYDVASRLIASSGQPIDIKITGLRVGEKLHEDLFGDGEIDERPYHPLISHALVPAIDPTELDAAGTIDSRTLMSQLS